MPNRRLTLATIFAVLLGLFAASSAHALPKRDPIPPPTNIWQNKGFILMAHQGGEWDFPPNTMFAYKSAMAAGADMLDMDAYVTADDEIVLTHDLEASDNSNAPTGDGYDINDLTLDQLRTYDFAYKWRPRGSSEDPPYRGISGDNPTQEPPAGFERSDFQIPTFGEVLDAFPNTPINIELKQVDGVDVTHTAEVMAGVLASHPGHDENVIINSFGQPMLTAMAAARPEHKSFGGSQNATTAYVVSGKPIVPTPVAIEPPDQFNLGTNEAPNWARTVPLIKPNADYDGYQIYVWGSDHDPAQDTPPFYAKLIAEGADSYNTPSPTRLAAYLCTAGIPKPDGSLRCDEQKCPVGTEGIGPNGCKPIPCPAGTEGTSPNCTPIPVPLSDAKVNKLSFAKAKPVKAGKKLKLTLKVGATDGEAGMVKITLKSSNRQVKLPKSVTVNLKPGATALKAITVKTTRKAKGKAKITATAQGKKGVANLKIKKAAKKAKRAKK